MNTKMEVLFLYCLSWTLSSQLLAESLNKTYDISFHNLALTANAGGQEALAMKSAFKNQYELALFSNNYLISNGTPLSGFTFSRRYAFCSPLCILNIFSQVGLGLSLAGPTIETTWGIVVAYILRLDFTTHFYFIKNRAITWNYPAWIGITIPLFSF